MRPSYWKFRGHPLKVVTTDDGSRDVLWLNPETKEWERYVTAWSAILGGDPDADELTEEDFGRWVAALEAGASEEEAWEAVLAQSSSLVEGVVEAIEGQRLFVRATWWKAEGGLLPAVNVGDWVQMRVEPEGAMLTELRPAPR